MITNLYKSTVKKIKALLLWFLNWFKILQGQKSYFLYRSPLAFLHKLCHQPLLMTVLWQKYYVSMKR